MYGCINILDCKISLNSFFWLLNQKKRNFKTFNIEKKS